MHRRIGLILLTGAFALAGAVGGTSYGLAQDNAAAGKIRFAEQVQKKKTDGKRTGAGAGQSNRGVAPKTGSPRMGSPSVSRRTVSPTVSPTVSRRRTVSPTTSSRTVSPRGGTVSPGIVSPGGMSPRIGSPSGRVGFRAVGSRGAGRVAFHGRNYSVWRGGPYRHRYRNRWRTFVALSALSVLAVGGAAYYPYAYVSAPAPVCEGETDDGCLLRWEEVPTVEGPREFQCVAYCPWQ